MRSGWGVRRGITPSVVPVGVVVVVVVVVVVLVIVVVGSIDVGFAAVVACDTGAVGDEAGGHDVYLDEHGSNGSCEECNKRFHVGNFVDRLGYFKFSPKRLLSDHPFKEVLEFFDLEVDEVIEIQVVLLAGLGAGASKERAASPSPSQLSWERGLLDQSSSSISMSLS